MDDVRRAIDGYDTGVRYADDSVGRLVAKLDELGVLEDTVVVVTGDHGETLGELGIYCDHQTADEQTAHVPMILRWPGFGDAGRGRVDRALHYQFDVSATLLELAGGRVPRTWDGESFAPALRAGEDAGREALVLSQGAWTCQRSVRFDDWLCIETLHDGYHAFPDTMLFDVANDPHEQNDLAQSETAVVAAASRHLEQWRSTMLRKSPHAVDPIATVLREGGPFHCRGELPAYLDRLRETGREAWAEELARSHGAALA